jgi:hypothetical protein
MIKGFETTNVKNTIKTDFPVELMIHKLGYTLGKGSQFRVNILAESFEVAQDIIIEKYGKKKGFNIFQFEVARPENAVHIISPEMEKKMLKALIAKHGEPEKPKEPKGPSILDRITGR